MISQFDKKRNTNLNNILIKQPLFLKELGTMLLQNSPRWVIITSPVAEIKDFERITENIETIPAALCAARGFAAEAGASGIYYNI